MRPSIAQIAVATWLGIVGVAGAADTSQFTSICDCSAGTIPCAGSVRWAVKTETNQPPATSVKKVTPTAISHWPDLAPDPVTHTYKTNAPRVKAEMKWYEVTGRVVLIRAEDDGDLHIQLQDVNGIDGSVNVVVEVPAGAPWCDVRTKVFALINRQLPFSASGDTVPLTRANAVIKVVGRAFYDGQHATANHPPNLRMSDKKSTNVTIWEIHPVMKLDVVN